MTYHLTIPALWVQNGGYTRLLAPDAWQDYSHFPHNGEILYAWTMAPFRSDLLVNPVNFPFLLLIALSIYALCRELDAGREESAWAAIMVILAPPVLYYLRTAYVDNQVLATMIAGWPMVDDPGRPATIAFASGFDLAGHNWFMYPLMGRKLQNRLVYASPTKSGELASYVPSLMQGKEWDADAWLQRLREEKVDLLFIQMPEPPELAWVERYTTSFRPLDEASGYRIYEFTD